MNRRRFFSIKSASSLVRESQLTERPVSLNSFYKTILKYQIIHCKSHRDYKLAAAESTSVYFQLLSKRRFVNKEALLQATVSVFPVHG